MLKSNTTILSCLILYIFFSDLSFSQTFMAENLFLTLGLCTIYIYINLSDKSYKYNFFSGILTYILYLTKEIGIVFIIAQFIITCIKIFQKKKILKKEIINYLILFLGFLIPYLIMKNIFFIGLDNTYSHQLLNVFALKDGIKYLFYSSLVLFSWFSVSIMINPILLLLLKRKRLNKNQKSMACLLFFLVILEIGIIAYTIYLPENLNDIIPRTHLRYFSYLYIPFIILFYSILENSKEKIKSTDLIIGMIFILVIFIFFKTPKDGSGVDYTTLRWIDLVGIEKISNLKVYVMFLIMMFVFLFDKNKIKIIKISFFIVVLGIEILNNKETIHFNKRNKISKIEALETIKLNNYIKNNKNKIFLFINVHNQYQLVYDTYIDNWNNVFYVESEKYLKIQNLDGINLNKNKIDKYPKLLSVDYIIIPKNVSINLSENKKILNFGDFDVLELKNKYQLPKLSENLTEFQATKNGAFFEKNGILNLPKDGLIYGPYMKLNAGRYKVEFLNDFSKNTNAEFKITKNTGEEVSKVLSKEKNVILEFELPENAINVEFVVHNIGESEFKVNGIYLYDFIKKRYITKVEYE